MSVNEVKTLLNVLKAHEISAKTMDTLLLEKLCERLGLEFVSIEDLQKQIGAILHLGQAGEEQLLLYSEAYLILTRIELKTREPAKVSLLPEKSVKPLTIEDESSGTED